MKNKYSFAENLIFKIVFSILCDYQIVNAWKLLLFKWNHYFWDLFFLQKSFLNNIFGNCAEKLIWREKTISKIFYSYICTVNQINFV